MIDLDQFENTAAWLEHCDGMSRFAAETEAARRQGVKRWQVMDHAKNNGGDTQGRGDQRQASSRHAADNLPRVQPASEKEG